MGSHCTRLPITVHWLAKMNYSWSANRPKRDALMLWVAATMCFFGFLRMGKVIVPSDSAFDNSVHLSVSDVIVDGHTSHTYVVVNIKASKTDSFREGVTIYLGRTHARFVQPWLH